MTKIGIPLENNHYDKSNISSHFGRAPYYALFETNNNELSIIENKSNHFGGVKHPVEFLIDNEVQIVICKGIGKHAFNEFKDANISIYRGENKHLMDTIEDYKQEKLILLSGEKTCNGHGMDHGHKHDY